jgi:hypothetical protein
MQDIWLYNLLSHKSNLGLTKRKHEDILKLRGGRSGLSCGSQKWALVTLPQQNASARRPPTCITGRLRIDPPARCPNASGCDGKLTKVKLRLLLVPICWRRYARARCWLGYCRVRNTARAYQRIRIYGWLGWYCSFEFAGRVEGGGVCCIHRFVQVSC